MCNCRRGDGRTDREHAGESVCQTGRARPEKRLLDLKRARRKCFEVGLDIGIAEKNSDALREGAFDSLLYFPLGAEWQHSNPACVFVRKQIGERSRRIVTAAVTDLEDAGLDGASGRGKRWSNQSQRSARGLQ